MEQKDFNILERDAEGNTALHFATRNTEGEGIVEMLLHHADFRADMASLRGSEGMTPLHNAVEIGHKGVVRMLLAVSEVKTEVNTPDAFGQTPLHAATESECSVEIFMMLLGVAGVDVNARDAKKRSVLFLCAGAQNGFRKVRALLSHKDFDMDSCLQPDVNGQTPLHIAIECRGGLETTRMLLGLPGTRATVNARDADGRTALYFALENLFLRRDPDGLQTVRLLLQRRDLDLTPWTHPGAGEWLSLRDCVEWEDPVTCRFRVETVRMILRHPAGVCVNTTDEEQSTWLHHAVKGSNQVEMVRMLLAQPWIQIDVCDSEKRTPLHLAAANENGTEMVRMLLAHVCDLPERRLVLTRVFSPCAKGWTPLHYAAGNRKGGLESVRMLLEIMPDDAVNALDQNMGLSAMHLAVGNSLETTRLFLQQEGIDMEPWLRPDSEGWRMLRTATDYRDWRMPRLVENMRVILRHRDVSVNTRDAGILKRTWLHNAANDENGVELVRMLLEVPGIEINARDTRDRTPLHLACRVPNGTEMVRMLLEHPGFDAALSLTPDEDGRTPLHLAAANEKSGLESARLVLGIPGVFANNLQGANTVFDVRHQIRFLNARDNDNATALHFAGSNTNGLEIMRILLSIPGIDVHVRDNEGQTPLDSVCASNNQEAARLFS